jgi:hypothetical protein
MSRGSLFFVRTVDVVHAEVAGNTSPTLAFLRGIGLVVGQMFDWGQIWTVRRPIEWVNVMIGEKILTNYGYMGPGVILLEN